MFKLFISQPMSDKSNTEITQVRNKAKKIVEEEIGDEAIVLESFFEDMPHYDRPLWYLSKALQLMSIADVVYFAKGWQDYRGCRIEHECAEQYGFRIIEE